MPFTHQANREFEGRAGYICLLNVFKPELVIILQIERFKAELVIFTDREFYGRACIIFQIESFKAELNVVNLSHPNVVNILASTPLEDMGAPYLIMEYVGERNLQQVQ